MQLSRAREEKLKSDLRKKLKTCWRKIYRGLVHVDEEKTHIVSIQNFEKVLH